MSDVEKDMIPDGSSEKSQEGFQNISINGFANLDGVDPNAIVLEENLLKIENEKIAREEVREREQAELGNEVMSSKMTDEEEREKEMNERCQRLMHLLQRSRMYVAELNKQVKAHDFRYARKKDSSKKEADCSKFNTCLEDNLEDKELGSCRKDEEYTENDDKDFFKTTYSTSLGFVVSSYQPVLFEGGTLRNYQLKGLEWLASLFANGVNGILADEMGLGKTLQVIALICKLIETGVSGPFLIVAPLSTIGNWLSEFNRFAPKVPTLFFHGSKKDRKNLVSDFTKPVTILGKKVLKVVITSYEVVLFEKKTLSKIMWPYIVVDEGHRVKNHDSQLSRALREFNVVGKLLVTGTPIQNNLRELWSLLNFIIPEVFSSVDLFESWFTIQELELGGKKIMDENNINVISTLQQVLIPFILRREKKDVDLKLPPKREVLVYCPMTTLQKKLYEATVDRSIELVLNPKRTSEALDLHQPLPKRACVLHKNLVSLSSVERCSTELEEYRERYSSNSEINSNDFELNIVMRNPQMQLRKIVNHPYLIQFPLIPGTDQLKIDEQLVKDSGKLLVVDAMLSKLKSQGHKVIIFSTFKVMLDLLEYLADMRGYRYCRFDGSSKLEERQESILKFNSDPDILAFFITIRAGGLGINLTAADTIIIYDSDWNPQVNLQSQDRCHRIGQTKPVVVYKLCSKGTIDERIIERGNAKRRLEKMIIQKGRFAKGIQNFESTIRLNVSDLQELKNLLSSTDYESAIHSNGFVFTDDELEALLDRSEMTTKLDDHKHENKENNNTKIFKLLNCDG